ncbi:hypothetical protein L1887_50660 [Cichorium endivia]|nr:hypothetical protein L1887_50660 [Cichorium endivia]
MQRQIRSERRGRRANIQSEGDRVAGLDGVRDDWTRAGKGDARGLGTGPKARGGRGVHMRAVAKKGGERREPSLPSQVEARDGDFWLGLPQSRCQGGATDRAARGDPKLSPSHGAAALPYLGWSVAMALEWEKGAASAHARSSNLPSARSPFARSSCQVSRHTSAISPHPPPLDLSRRARLRLNRKPHSEFAVAPRCLSSWEDAKVGSASVVSRRAVPHRTCMAISCDHGRHGLVESASPPRAPSPSHSHGCALGTDHSDDVLPVTGRSCSLFVIWRTRTGIRRYCQIRTARRESPTIRQHRPRCGALTGEFDRKNLGQG